MKKSNIILLSLALISVLAGCSKQGPEDNDDAMRFVPSLPSSTRATDIAFENGDAFGIYAVEYNGSSPAELLLSGNWANNAKASFDGSNWTVSPTIWWKDGTKFDILAYYPYNDEINSIDEYLFEVQTDQTGEGFTKSDLMCAKAQGVEREDGDIALNFKHKMSRLDINLIKGEDYEGDLPANAEIRIMNTVTTALVDIEKGVLEKNPTGITKTIIARKADLGKYSAIIVPQKLLTNVPLIEIVANNVSYVFNTRFSFDSGVRHTINITLTSDPNKALINIGGKIDDWN
jgi:hypothetical protein